jgi:hypothetical protein
MDGSKSGSTPRPKLLCRGASSRPRDMWPAIGGGGRYRGPDGHGIASYFREAPHGVMQTHAQPPRPRMLSTSDLRQGSRPAAGCIGRCPKVGRALRHDSLAHSSISGYVAKVAAWDNGTMASAADVPFPVMEPPATPRIAGPCFLQDSMHGDSYPCCRPSIRLCLPAYSSKALTDVEIAAPLPGASCDERPALVDHSRARKANWLASRFESVHPEWQAYAASVKASFPPLSK